MGMEGGDGGWVRWGWRWGWRVCEMGMDGEMGMGV